MEKGGAPITSVEPFMNATRPVQPPLDGSVLWRLVSVLSMNLASLLGTDAWAQADDAGTEENARKNAGAGLRELLHQHNHRRARFDERHIEGISDVRCETMYAPVRGEGGIGFARGQRIILEFDDAYYPAGGVFLFASVLERVMGLFTSLNSFTAVSARLTSEEKPFKEWEPRSGCRPLI
jgi:type VI secretion system protein ImpG